MNPKGNKKAPEKALLNFDTPDGAPKTGVQDMNTAMNASKKISSAPPTGNTMGMRGTMASTTSCSPAWLF
jgi:hypothetical protein